MRLSASHHRSQAGSQALISVDERTCTSVAGLGPNGPWARRSSRCHWGLSGRLPVIVTVVPPGAGPFEGLTPVTIGARTPACALNMRGLLRRERCWACDRGTADWVTRDVLPAPSGTGSVPLGTKTSISPLGTATENCRSAVQLIEKSLGMLSSNMFPVRRL